MDLLTHLAVVAAIRQAWLDSEPHHPAARHEEGGYIVQTADLSYGVERWPSGDQSQIVPPPLEAGNRYHGRTVVATFHTHPNPPVDEVGDRWDPQPSESDKRWHGRRQLRGIVVSDELVFEIDPRGNFAVLGKRKELF